MNESKQDNTYDDGDEIYVKLSPWMKGFIYGLSAGIIGAIIGIWIANHFQ